VEEARSGPAAQPETEQLAAPAEPAPRKTARARRVPAAGDTEAPVEEVVGVATDGDGVVVGMTRTEEATAKPARKAAASKTAGKSAAPKSARSTATKSAAPKSAAAPKKSAAPKTAAKRTTKSTKAAVVPAEEPTPEGVAS